MANRTRPTLEKRNKERARQEKRKHKDERRANAKVQRANTPLPGNDNAGSQPKSHLGEHKPDPVNALVEYRIHDSENAVNQSSPEDRRDETSEQNRLPRKHRQHGAVEQTDQQ